MDSIKTQGLYFVDEKGRFRLFNGINIDDKAIGDVFRYDLDEEFFSKYKANGFNLIRLAITWANIEPEMEKYSESYLFSIDKIFRLAEKYGVYILLDMHQDLYSGYEGVGDGDGAPPWACVMDGNKPRASRLVWAEAYIFGKWVHSCFDHFWYNDLVAGRGLQDRFADMWKMLAERYGNSPALFGFDLLNEPFPGSYGQKIFFRLVASGARQIITSKKIRRVDLISALIKKDSKKLLDSFPGSVVRDIVGKCDEISGKFDRDYYSPFLNRVSAAIREVTKNGILMIEQPYFCNTGIRLGAQPITVNGEREPLQCYGPHSYDLTVDTPLYQYANADRVKAFFNEMRNAQMRLQVPAIVGEWGGCSNNKDTSWFPHANELLDYFDENKWGQLYWDYHGDDLDAPLMDMLSRTYPVAVNGTDVNYYRSDDKKKFTLNYISKEQGETLIYAHKPCKIETNGYITVTEEYKNGSSLISVTAGKGENFVILKFD